MKVRREMAECRATSARSGTRVNCERDKQDARTGTTRSSENFGLRTVVRLTSRAFPASLDRLA